MGLYVYLAKPEYVYNWVNGGLIPLSLASSYRKIERSGIFTPDEVIQRSLAGCDYDYLQSLNLIDPDSPIKSLKIGKVTDQYGNIYAQNINYSYTFEDALLLCFCTHLDRDIADRMIDQNGKPKRACVEIVDFLKLKNCLDRQLLKPSLAKECSYTTTKNRNHFLKHIDDSWQKEFRIVWKNFYLPQQVILPKFCAKDVSHKIF